jgi:hypothetical protein
MACPKRERLQERYAEAIRLYSEAVQNLRENMGKLPAEAYIQLDRRKEWARLDSETARLDQERHVADHGCRDA